MSTVQIGALFSAREQQKPFRAGSPVAVEKGNPPRSNLRSGRYQVARRGRKSRAAGRRSSQFFGTERDDRLKQNSAYSLFFNLSQPGRSGAQRHS